MNVHLPTYVCLSCFNEQPSLLSCRKCKGRKLEHIEFKRMMMGEHWRELLKAERGLVN